MPRAVQLGQARSWERHFRRPIEPFTAEERDRVTILFGGLTWKHEKLRKQYVYGYMAFLNINICCNNTEDVRQLTEYAHAHRIATDYHINETPCWANEHFKQLNDNPILSGRRIGRRSTT